MAQDITLQGATYSDVPAVDLPTSSGTARFMDTSDATASASKILSGYTAYVDGSLVIGTYQGGGASYGKYTKLESGTVTFASRYQTTGNRLICSLADIGFTPTFFMLSATKATIDAICTSLTSGTESNNVIIRAIFVTDSGTSYTFSQRIYERIGGTSPSASGGSSATSWTTQTNNYLYNNGTNIYYRTASNYGLPKDGEYVWLAMA